MYKDNDEERDLDMSRNFDWILLLVLKFYQHN